MLMLAVYGKRLTNTTFLLNQLIDHNKHLHHLQKEAHGGFVCGCIPLPVKWPLFRNSQDELRMDESLGKCMMVAVFRD